MNKFALRVFIFSILFLSCGLLTSMYAPYYWGNPWYRSKVQFLQKSSASTSYNTFFFGSSRIYRHLNPKVFDSSSKSIRHTSYNLGAPATFSPQSYYLYEHFLNSKISENARYCFLELTDIEPIEDALLSQDRTTYWQNTSDIGFVLESFLQNKKMTYKSKIKHGSKYVRSYIEKLISLGYLRHTFNGDHQYDEEYLGFAKDGFLPLEYNLKHSTNPVVKGYLRDIRLKLETNPMALVERKARIEGYYEAISEQYDAVNLKRVNALIEQSEEQGIHLIFILSPRNGSQRLINLSRQIPKGHLIDMANPKSNAELYQYDNSFDVGHLNTAGATKYSKKIAEAFMKIVDL